MTTEHYQPRPLPETLTGLATLALDLRWSWHHGSDVLWQQLGEELWQTTQNPWLILESVSDARLQQLSHEPAFLSLLRQQLDERDNSYAEPAWFDDSRAAHLSGQVAYFSMEFGISESLPIYSGGLGILAGDTMKTASDLDVPVIGVGLLYQQGYFRQTLDTNGEQQAHYPFNDPSMLPIVPLRDAEGEWVTLALPFPGRTVRIRTWKVQVGRRTLLLLDSNHPANSPVDRSITGQLYGGGQETRLQQEWILGIGGWRLLERLGVHCPVCHLNEGHAAFAILERVRSLMQRTGEPFSVAMHMARSGTLFTTHTPVKAGFDRYPLPLMQSYFSEYVQELKLDWSEFMALGSVSEQEDGTFNMAYLAIRGAQAVNAVSRLHGQVSQALFQPLFPRWPQAQVPVGYITNGIHVPSWDSAEADAFWTQQCGKERWRGDLSEVSRSLSQASDEQLWHFRNQKRQHLTRLLLDHPSFDPSTEVLTLGFARRFAEYKRTNLLLRFPERLKRLLSNKEKPVRLIFAGKAHPNDKQGQWLIKQWIDFIQREQLQHQVFFLEDYDLQVAARLVQGVDVWLNTPRRPWEACGTSGMKVLVNGGLNLSVKDGWWDEAYSEDVGWALPDHTHATTEEQDAFDAEQLFQLLESDVVPMFYERNEQGLPSRWLKKMKSSLCQLTGRFSSNRMLRQYTDQYYIPLANNQNRMTVAKAQLATQQHQQLTSAWSGLAFKDWHTQPTEEGWNVQVWLDCGVIPEDQIQVELYADPKEPGGAPEIVPLTPKTKARETKVQQTTPPSQPQCYQAQLGSLRSVTDFTPRVIAKTDGDVNPLIEPLIFWFDR